MEMNQTTKPKERTDTGKAESLDVIPSGNGGTTGPKTKTFSKTLQISQSDDGTMHALDLGTWRVTLHIEAVPN